MDLFISGVSETEQFKEDELKKYEQELESEMKHLMERKEKLKKYKEKMGKDKPPTKQPPSKDRHRAGNVPPPPPAAHPAAYYDVDGEKVANYDAMIDDYRDYRDIQFEEH